MIPTPLLCYMPDRAPPLRPKTSSTRVIEAATDAEAVREHVLELIESSAFRGSRRSQQFLQFVVDRVLSGNLGDLKERALGVELFGRSPSYDTGDDSIVRVTASDVRKRLCQYYSDHANSNLRLEIPAGSYAPEFRAPAAFQPEASPVEGRTIAKPQDSAEAPRILRPVLCFLVGAILASLAIWFRFGDSRLLKPVAYPWSALLGGKEKVHIVFCDPDIVSIQSLLDFNISLPDYANQRYWPEDRIAEEKRFQTSKTFRGANVASVDAEIALKISQLADYKAGPGYDVKRSRTIRLTDFKTDDNFVLLGSPRSNPWFNLFSPQLEFAFAYDPVEQSEFVINKHPRNNEPAAFVPTAKGWGTGRAYSLIILTFNPNGRGRVLMIAGTCAEATQASGDLVTNPVEFQHMMKKCGLGKEPQQLELLLRLSIMAGSPTTFDAVAWRSAG